MKLSRSALVKVAGAALALAALGTASVAQARSNVFFSVSAPIAPGVNLGVSNSPYYQPNAGYYPAQAVYSQPVYSQPVYSQPVYSQPVYSQPVYYPQQQVYYEPAPVYYRPAPVYYRPAPVVSIGYGGWYGGHRGWGRHYR